MGFNSAFKVLRSCLPRKTHYLGGQIMDDEMGGGGRVARNGFSVQTLRKETARRTRYRGDDNVKNYLK